jgi:hypothetical protein
LGDFFTNSSGRPSSIIQVSPCYWIRGISCSARANVVTIFWAIKNRQDTFLFGWDSGQLMSLVVFKSLRPATLMTTSTRNNVHMHKNILVRVARWFTFLQTKNSNSCKFWKSYLTAIWNTYLTAIWYIVRSFGIFHVHWVYFAFIWYILRSFGIFCVHLVYFTVFWYILRSFSIFWYVFYKEKSGNPDFSGASKNLSSL